MSPRRSEDTAPRRRGPEDTAPRRTGPDGWHDIIRRYLPEAVYEKIVQDYET